MDDTFRRLVEINVMGRVMAACSARGISDPGLLAQYNSTVLQAIQASMSDVCTPAEFDEILKRQMEWLEQEFDSSLQQLTAPPRQPEAEADTEEPPESEPEPESAPKARPRRAPSGYVPEGKSMPERLAEQRELVEELLKNDCVNLGLVTCKQAEQMSRGMVGREPKKAEADIVVELRATLHTQIRKFLRKHKGGPWNNPKAQEVLRIEIASTGSLRSLVQMARSILSERDEWLMANRGKLSSLLFGGKVRAK
ncbi:hypothetical protein [Candidatus Endoriftia persephonae]|jgi:hypothetical protein|uniref:Uncharacterized protein n=2 Tax=Gammaproteobacteria TaxID=1236 RepID=G2FEP3_9GAMM|nr:hypothetical protein [Candidatus Endoriftia persephone]EGW54812.1 hypothetical protein TevJSym_ai00920 [endosymbiont of Tevnia jerichonana (vent Tica)]USF87327.1 hypothetical protein L0Y14_14520 [Candidatus Endoriftia persephone]